MKKLLFVVVLSLVSSAVFAQETKEPKNNEEAGYSATAHYSNLYQRAVRYNDFGVAKHALYNLVNLYPQNDSLLFSLSVLYFQMQQYPSAALTANDVLSLNPDHTGALEISAVSFAEIGARDKAINAYEQLFLRTGDFQTLYQLAFLQYEAGRLNESLANVDILLKKKEASELTVTFNTANNEAREYPIKAAILNLKGLIHQGMEQPEEAKKYFNEALAVAPDFEMAKQNLESLNGKKE